MGAERGVEGDGRKRKRGAECDLSTVGYLGAYCEYLDTDLERQWEIEASCSLTECSYCHLSSTKV